jgi:hypothetical protein
VALGDKTAAMSELQILKRLNRQLAQILAEAIADKWK